MQQTSQKDVKKALCTRLFEKATGRLLFVSGQERNHGLRRKKHCQSAIFTTNSKVLMELLLIGMLPYMATRTGSTMSATAKGLHLALPHQRQQQPLEAANIELPDIP